MRFQAGDSMVDVLVDIDRFELQIARFLPEAEPGQVESARSLLEPDHADLERGLLILAIQTFVLHAPGGTILVDTCVGEGKERPRAGLSPPPAELVSPTSRAGQHSARVG